MPELSLNSKLLKAILQSDNLKKTKEEILDEEISIPLEMIKLGYNNSIWGGGRREPKAYDKSADWIHIAAFCEESDAECFIEDAFLSEVRFKGDCLLAMWIKNPKKTLYWLELIHEYDSLFNSLNFRSTKLVYNICTQLNCDSQTLFLEMYLSDDKSKNEKLEKSVKKVLSTEIELREEYVLENGRYPRDFGKMLQEILEERDFVISAEALTEDQADRIFNALWNSNIELDSPSEEITNRHPFKVFVGRRDEDSGWNYIYGHEIRQLLEVIQWVSEAQKDKVATLFKYLPFWLDRFITVEKAMFRFEPEMVKEQWKEILLKDVELGDSQRRNETFWLNIGQSFGRIQPKTQDILYGLEKISDSKDNKILVSLMNHYSDVVREKIQELLKESL